MKDSEDPIVVYLIVRESLGMSIGKTAAQVGHAVQYLMEAYIDERCIGQDLVLMFDVWLNSSCRKIVLKADEKEWKKIKEEVNHEIVIDAGITELEPGTETVIALYPMYKSQVPKLIQRLQVL